MYPRCAVCSEENVSADHETSQGHLKNYILKKLAKNKYDFENTNGIAVTCTVGFTAENAEPFYQDTDYTVLKVSIKPGEEIKFAFSIKNNNQHGVVLRGVAMFHSETLNFDLVGSNSGFDPTTRPIPPNETLKCVAVKFGTAEIGTYLMRIFFLFIDNDTSETTITVKQMMVYVENVKKPHIKIDSPYSGESVLADLVIPATGKKEYKHLFRLPSDELTEAFKMDLKIPNRPGFEEIRVAAKKAKNVLKAGRTEKNYRKYFHNLLWFEEAMLEVNLNCYNMSGVALVPAKKTFSLRVPGLVEKRPALITGDLVHVRPSGQTELLFEAVIVDIRGNEAFFGHFAPDFKKYHSETAKFDIRFITSRLPLERMHEAVESAPTEALDRTFPQRNQAVPATQPMDSYFNPLVAANPEQRSVVEHIVAGTSGRAPYLLFGPPGTGKTVTIVEAILQLAKDPSNHIMVCTDSNAAADYVATVLLQYRSQFHEEQFLLRANSKFRKWESLPVELEPFCNGADRRSWKRVTLDQFMDHRVVVTTLIHAANFGRLLQNNMKRGYTRETTYLFIDEAAQASEPAALVPLCGLLARAGRLVLAGDPLQLGPVCLSREAGKRGLGISLMERLKTDSTLYNAEVMDPNYIMMLKKNFRSDADILSIPSELYYNNQLEALAPLDDLSRKDILLAGKKSRAIAFHGVLSQEQTVGKSPSYYNSMEVELVQKYIKALIDVHRVSQGDIGVITPYSRQAHKIKEWLKGEGLPRVDVGTVEAFQGREKRVMLVSTVRARVDLQRKDHFRLGFVKEPKRFNVVITRAKAKLIVIGNPLCLQTDDKWRLFMQRCRDFGTYTGFDATLAERDDQDNLVTPMLQEMTKALKELNISK